MPVAGVARCITRWFFGLFSYTEEFDVSSLNYGANSVKITNQTLISAFNNASYGDSFAPSVEVTYGNDESGTPITRTTNAASAFIPKIIALASIPSKNTTDVPFSIMDFLTTISTGALTFSSSAPGIATINSLTGLVTPVGAGTTTITANVAATANHPAGSASTTLTIVLLRLASNGLTIQYTGTTQAVIDAYNLPTPSPLFILANPKGTGEEWFAVVNNSSNAKITSYANNNTTGINYFTKSGLSDPVPFKNIVTTLITDMSNMFLQCYTFNSDISSWDTGSVVNMDTMFNSATSFNQNIGSWNTALVQNMYRMFGWALAFNQNIGSWNVSNVTLMSDMFRNAATFNQNLSGWNVARVSSTSRYNVFTGSPLGTLENSYKQPQFV